MAALCNNNMTKTMDTCSKSQHHIENQFPKHDLPRRSWTMCQFKLTSDEFASRRPGTARSGQPQPNPFALTIFGCGVFLGCVSTESVTCRARRCRPTTWLWARRSLKRFFFLGSDTEERGGCSYSPAAFFFQH
jgi:hypothetical protein